MSEEKKLAALSEEFVKAFRAGRGSITGECEFCKRIYFSEQDSDRGAYDEGELEDLQAKAKQYPEKYISLDYGPSFVTVNGQDYVLDCPCNGPRLFEDWIWSHRWQIADYLKDRCAKRLEKAKDDYEKVKTIPRTINLHARRVEGVDEA